MTNKRRQSRHQRRHQIPSAPTDEQALAALYAAALGLLLAGLSGDSARVAAEGERIIRIGGEKTVAGVLAFMTAAAANGYEYEHGSREAAIDAVTADLATVLLQAEEGTA